jgi:hypothetical protein
MKKLIAILISVVSLLGIGGVAATTASASSTIFYTTVPAPVCQEQGAGTLYSTARASFTKGDTNVTKITFGRYIQYWNGHAWTLYPDQGAYGYDHKTSTKPLPTIYATNWHMQLEADKPTYWYRSEATIDFYNGSHLVNSQRKYSPYVSCHY